MASSVYVHNDSLRHTKRCVLIDGNFGRHELFTNVHPYTLNHLARSNDVAAFCIRSRQAMELMYPKFDVHYHICYSVTVKEVDEYYQALKSMYPRIVRLHPLINTTEAHILQYAIDECKNQCNYIWIIHGMENQHHEAMEQLKYQSELKIHISNYSWSENLIEGSNRIEYLLK